MTVLQRDMSSWLETQRISMSIKVWKTKLSSQKSTFSSHDQNYNLSTWTRRQMMKMIQLNLLTNQNQTSVFWTHFKTAHFREGHLGIGCIPKAQRTMTKGFQRTSYRFKSNERLIVSKVCSDETSWKVWYRIVPLITELKSTPRKNLQLYLML